MLPSEAEEWTAGVSVHYRTGTVFGLCCLCCFWILSYLRLRIGLCRFEDSAEFPSCTSYFRFSSYIKNVLSFAFTCAMLKDPVKLLSG